jgi:small subunit ribosomal protein S3
MGVIHDWSAHWFASGARDFKRMTLEDQSIRGLINNRYGDSGAISRIDIERGPQDLVVTINTARPGIIIGRGGQRVDELRGELEKRTGKKARLNIQEIRAPELDASLVARSVAEQIERRVAYRRAMRLAIQRTMQSGALGVKIVCSGRLAGAEIARRDKAMEGRIPLHTLRADIDYAHAEADTTFGKIGVKCWIYKGNVLPTAQNLRLRSLARLSAGQPGQGTPASAGATGQ